MALSTLSTENWIALVAIFAVVLTSIVMTVWHHIQKKNREYDELIKAYRGQEKEVNQRTQKLRATNNQLYDEIAQHELTEEKLRRSQNYLSSIIDSMPSILIGVTLDGKITHWNTRAEKISGCTERDALHKKIQDVYPSLAVDLQMIHDAIKEKTPKKLKSKLHMHLNEAHYYDIAVYPLASNTTTSDSEAVIRVDDVTVSVLMENRMIQNEKMMSLGELAAGLAHEINNPLGAILQNVQNIERRTSSELSRNKAVAEQAGTNIETIEKYFEEREIKKFLHGIRDAGERSARIVSNMLEFSHKSQQKTEININDLARNCLELSENNFKIQLRGARVKIRIKTIFDEAIPLVMCSPAEIQQVLLNLLRNASHAFLTDGPEENKIRDVIPNITIRTSQKDGYVVLSIRDNGPGMREQICRHIFEPFFTTKETGRGTGLGLSISYFIINEHHHGSIDVESTLGVGTEFTIKLPLLPMNN